MRLFGEVIPKEIIQNNMQSRLTILTIVLFFGCKTEYRNVVDTYSNGKVKEEYVYPNKKDKSKFTIIEYYPNGQISFKGEVENNKFIGMKLNYYENGNLKEVDSILNSCNLDFCCCDGFVKKYYSNGKPDQTFENRNGVANGLVSLYSNDSSGKLVTVSAYQEGKKNGISKTYYDNGKLYKLCSYKNDTAIGHIYYFETNGDTMKIYSTWKGHEDFPTKKWLTNGQIFYATYLDSTYNKVLYRWTDKAGLELKRQIPIHTKGEKWVTPN